jgi:hypothetical protein
VLEVLWNQPEYLMASVAGDSLSACCAWCQPLALGGFRESLKNLCKNRNVLAQVELIFVGAEDLPPSCVYMYERA